MRKLTFKDFVERSVALHGGKYEYPAQEYISAKSKIRIICPVHGEFKQTPDDHRKSGCNKCGEIEAAKKLRSKSTLQSFIAEARDVHGLRYYYPPQKWLGYEGRVNIGCYAHGIFSQDPSNHKQGNGCPVCGVEKSRDDKRDDLASFIAKARAVHGDLYEYPDQRYFGTKSAMTIICAKHGAFEQIPNNHLCGQGCPTCGITLPSKGETTLAESFSGASIVRNYRVDVSKLTASVSRKEGARAKRMELDVYFKDKSLAVEFNGLYWHSENSVGKNYHKGKTDVCAELGIDLIQIFEDEWHDKKEIVKSIVNTRLGVYDNRYYARNTKLVSVDSATAGKFYDANHIQGKAPASAHFGLETGGELLAMVSFGNRSHLFKNSDDLELIRFCTKLNTQVVGGLSKLLSVRRDVTVKTYCDLRLFNGGGYKAVGFKELHVSPPSYFYVKGLKRFSRFNFQKHKLAESLENFDPSLTEVENMANNGYSRIFDCGTLVMELPPRNSQ